MATEFHHCTCGHEPCCQVALPTRDGGWRFCRNAANWEVVLRVQAGQEQRVCHVCMTHGHALERGDSVLIFQGHRIEPFAFEVCKEEELALPRGA